MNINVNEQSCNSQVKRILKHMQDGGKITALDALYRFGCLNLKGRIWDIKSIFGIDIKRKYVKLEESGKRVMEYWIEK